MNSDPRSTEPTTYTELTPRFLTAECEQWISAYKDRFLARLKQQAGSELAAPMIRQAVNEAGALAALTPFPALFLPTLLEEKVAQARAWAKRQRRLTAGRQISLSA